jgi:UDPglucose 6-dehydrogenase
MKHSAVSVVGLGKLGTALAACLAARGFRVIGVDRDAARVGAVNAGAALACEPDLAAILARGRDRLRATGDLDAAVSASDATFVLVQTPATAPDGISVEFVRAACRDLGRALRCKADDHLIVIASTMAPGSTEAVAREELEGHSGKLCGPDFGLCYAPEFVALGSLVDGFLHPPLAVIGQHDARSGDALAALYEDFFDPPVEIVRCSIAAAELAKIALNAFLATKISFANVLAGLCERGGGADVDEVTAILERDPRVGRGFLQGRASFGGPCLPRDVAVFKRLVAAAGLDESLAAAVEQTNLDRLRHLEWLVRERARTIEERRGRPARVAILGLAFKPGSDSTEYAPGWLLCERLSRLGLRVVAHDPVVTAPRNDVALAARPDECVRDADLLVIATAWPQYARLSAEEVAGKVVIDCWRILAPPARRAAAEYVCLGAAPPLRAP